MEALKVDLIVVPAAFVVAAVCWIVGLGSQLAYSIIPEWAFALWAVVNGLTVTTIGFDFSLAPSLVTVGVWFLLAFGAKRLVEEFSAAEADGTNDDDSPWWKDIALALAAFVVAYAAPLLVLAILVGETTVTPFGFLRLFLLLMTASAAGWLWVRGVADIPRLQDLDLDVWDASARLVKRLLWSAAVLSIVVLAAGIVLRWSELTDSLQAYSSPAAAGLGLLVVQILFAPGILFAALSWVAGTGVDVGAGGPSSVFHSAPGPMPNVPVLQLLIGDYPEWTYAAPVLLVLVGVLAVILGRDHAWQVLNGSWLGLGIAAIKFFVVVEMLALFASGAMGPLGLSDFGPSPLTSGVVVTAWIALGLGIGLGLTRLSHMQSGQGWGASNLDDLDAHEPFARDSDED